MEVIRDYSQRVNYRHTYFMQAIPTVFEGYFGSSTEVFQYTTSEYSKEGPEAALMFM